MMVSTVRVLLIKCLIINVYMLLLGRKPQGFTMIKYSQIVHWKILLQC